MKKRYVYLIPIFFTVIVFSCTPNEETINELYENSVTCYNDSNFFGAEIYLDSIATLYGKTSVKYIDEIYSMKKEIINLSDSVKISQYRMEIEEYKEKQKDYNFQYEEKKQEHDKLLKNFKIKKDDFDKTERYTHKNQRYPNSKTILARVDNSGYKYIVSRYHDDDWIFHEKISVLIDEKKKTSKKIPSYDDDNVRDNYAGGIYEKIYFFGKNDNGIFKFIAKNYDKTVKVRFHGKYYDDVTLSSKDKIAIKETYDLGILIDDLIALKTKSKKIKLKIKRTKAKIENFYKKNKSVKGSK